MPARHALRAIGLNAIGCTMAATLCLAAVDASWAQSKAANPSASRYQAERANCMNGTSHQDRQTCLREAGAALQEARRGKLDNQQADAYERNAKLRCDPLPPSERTACEARMSGRGTVSGSVEGGGVYRELVEVVPADRADPPRAIQPPPTTPLPAATPAQPAQ